MAVIAAGKAIGEESAFKYLRLTGTITCPASDRHHDVIRYRLWPLLSGPLKTRSRKPL